MQGLARNEDDVCCWSTDKSRAFPVLEDSSEAYLRFVFKALLQEDMVQTDGCFAMGVPLSFPPSEPFFQVDVYF